jgi:hypothetical protein
VLIGEDMVSGRNRSAAATKSKSQSMGEVGSWMRREGKIKIKIKEWSQA